MYEEQAQSDEAARERLVEVMPPQQAVARFARERDWERFHSPKNLAMALRGEVDELAPALLGGRPSLATAAILAVPTGSDRAGFNTKRATGEAVSRCHAHPTSQGPGADCGLGLLPTDAKGPSSPT